MAAILPFLSGILLSLIFYDREQDWRVSVLFAAIVWGIFVTFTTEFLSLIHAINFGSIFAIWALLTSILTVGLIKNIATKKRHARQIQYPSILFFWRQVDDFERFVLIGIGMIILVVGAIAIFAPPNNWDSMTDVMPRIVHWIQAGSVAPFPTHYTPQLYDNPWTEFVIMHFQILSGGDFFANLPQFFSMIGCLLGVSLIAEKLGANLRGQIFSALVCATIPTGVLQASNSKNTYVIAFWLVCFICCGILIIKSQPSWKLILAASTSFSLAVLTKGTTYIYGLPFVIWFAFSIIKIRRFRSVNYAIAASLIFLSINLGYYLRNFFVFGSFISTYPYKWNNEIYSFPVFISNVVRNVALHLTPPFFASTYMDQMVIRLHELLGVNPVDPRINLFGGFYQPIAFTTQGLQTFEDTAGSSFHFWLLIPTMFCLFSCTALRRSRLLIIYFLLTISSFLLFCLLIKWQIWHTRIHLPIFVLLSPVMGIVLDRAFNRRISQYLILLILILSVPYLLFNETRPIARETNVFNQERIVQYFSARPTLQVNYEDLTDLISQKSCGEIALIQRPDAWEYPFWVLLNRKSKQPIRFENVKVTNPSGIIAQNPYYQTFRPCAVVSIGLPPVQQVIVHDQIYKNSDWRPKYSLEPMQVLFKN